MSGLANNRPLEEIILRPLGHFMVSVIQFNTQSVTGQQNIFFLALRRNAGYGLLILEVSGSHTHTQNHAPQSVGLLWTSDQPNAALTRDGHPCPRWDSNLQSQQASDHRTTP